MGSESCKTNMKSLEKRPGLFSTCRESHGFSYMFHYAQLVIKGSDTAFKGLVMSVCLGTDGFMEGTGESTAGKGFSCE